MSEAALVCLIVLALAVSVFSFLYFRYQRTPAARWKASIRDAVHFEEARHRHARQELAAIDRVTDDRALQHELLLRQLNRISINELARYPNIGPVTVSKLRAVGIATVAATRGVVLSSIPGIGPAREADLSAALLQIVREGTSRFDAGASPEGTHYKAALKDRMADNDRRRQVAEAELRSANEVLTGLRGRDWIASGITFFNFLRRRQAPGLTPEMMSQPLAVPPKPTAPPTAAPEPTTPVAKADPVVGTVVDAPPVPPTPKPVEVSPLERMRAVIAFGLAMAKADGRVAAAERKQVRAFAERRFTAMGNQLDATIKAIEDDVPTLGDALWQLKRVMPANSWPDLYRFAEAVADSAGQRNTREIEFLARIAEELGIGVKAVVVPQPAPVVVAVNNQTLSETDCRMALEIAAETALDVELIRRQHRLLGDRFDPEKFKIYGVDFVRLANEKRNRAEQAARHLLAGYNEPLEPPTPPPPADLRHNPDLDDVFGV